MGVAMSVVSASNIITGKELETANHVERFVKLWLAIGIVVPLYYFFEARRALITLSARRKIILGLLVTIVIAGNLWYAGDIGVFLHPEERLKAVRESQKYMPVYAWLDAQITDPEVIWVDPKSDLTGTLPIYTKHYVLYSSVAALHLVSDNEIEERYLVANYLHEPQPTVKSITIDARNFEGVSRGFHLANTHNRGVKICRILQLFRIGYDCGVFTNSETLNTPLGETMFKRYEEEIKPHIKDEVEKFHVMYIMKDKQNDIDFHPELIVTTPPVYEDQRFVIYKLN
jgi:hypothetical protein